MVGLVVQGSEVQFNVYHIFFTVGGLLYIVGHLHCIACDKGNPTVLVSTHNAVGVHRCNAFHTDFCMRKKG